MFPNYHTHAVVHVYLHTCINTRTETYTKFKHLKAAIN